jgi:hypothetical protein
MAKTCIFCGKHPESKNKEHVIPQWLIRMTGDPTRQINLGPDMRHLAQTGESRLLTYAFQAFTFPACEACNLIGAKLESKAKAHMEKIFANDYLSAKDIDELLDWFDKVRVGLWLGGLKLDGIEDYVQPGFYINQRIGQRDRSLLIYEMKQPVPDGINMVGTTSPGFQHIPSCFALRVNHLYFYNISFDFLFARRVGFPYPAIFAVAAENPRAFHLEYAAGTGRLKLPLLPFRLRRPGIAIHQPIIASETGEENYQKFFANPYVEEKLMDKYRGAIFYEEPGRLIHVDAQTELRLEGYQQLDPTAARSLIGKQVMQTTEDLLSRDQDLRNLDTEQQKIRKANMKIVVKAHRDLWHSSIKTNFS